MSPTPRGLSYSLLLLCPWLHECWVRARKENATFARFAGAVPPTSEQEEWIGAFQAGLQEGRSIPVICTEHASVRCQSRAGACELFVGTDGAPGWTTRSGPASIPVHVRDSLEEAARRTGGVLVSFGDHELAPPMFWISRVVFTEEPARKTALVVPGQVSATAPAAAGTSLPNDVPKKDVAQSPPALVAFLRNLKLEGKSVHTLRAYRHDLEQFAKDHPQLEEVSASEIRAHLRGLEDNGASAATVSRALATLKAFYRYLEQNEVVKRNPAKLVRFPRMPGGRPPKVLSVEEVDRLLDGNRAPGTGRSSSCSTTRGSEPGNWSRWTERTWCSSCVVRANSRSWGRVDGRGGFR